MSFASFMMTETTGVDAETSASIPRLVEEPSLEASSTRVTAGCAGTRAGWAAAAVATSRPRDVATSMAGGHDIHVSTPTFDALPGWQQSICREVRDLGHAADSEVAETVKRTDRPYFVSANNRADGWRKLKHEI